MCRVHGPLAPCRCDYANGAWALVAAFLVAGCALLSQVTPADRAKGYEAEAKTAQAECAAYKFDRAMGLTTDVPEMSRLCGTEGASGAGGAE